MIYEVRITQVTIAPPNVPIFDERATVIEIDDVASGAEFVQIKQSRDKAEAGCVAFDTDEWPIIRREVDAMVKRCRNYEESEG
jgi:hypothetical protein